MVLLWALGLCGFAHSQEGGIAQAYTKSPVFRIPFSPEGNERRWKQVELYVSSDQGRTWGWRANAPPDQGFFTFTADRDGVFWFATRTVDVENRTFPPSMENAQPQLKVTVDTQPPFISLRGLPPQDGSSQFQWEIRDDNLDLSSLAVDYRVQGLEEWRPLSVQRAATGRQAWRPSTNGPMEVRLRVRDLAGNENEQRASVQPPDTDGRLPDHRFTANTEPARNTYSPPAPPRANVSYVNSKQIELNYRLKDVGKSGVSVVELWVTQDGRGWNKDPREEKIVGNDSLSEPRVFKADVYGEGIYGLTLVVKSGVGLGDRPPQANDPPQRWVEVDLTKPVVQIVEVKVGRGDESGKLFISYRATDKNLGPRPITLSYLAPADQPGGGTWKPIQADLENTGRYIWQMPNDLPFQFFVKVEAVDKAGNVGADQTQNVVKVDLAIPKSEILDVAPAKPPLAAPVQNP